MRNTEPPKDYGYHININEPPFDDLYRRYKQYKGIPSNMPCSDEERHEFEAYFIGVDLANKSDCTIVGRKS